MRSRGEGPRGRNERDEAVQVDIEARAVRAQLERILDSTDFDASKRNRRFLTYIVGEALAGRGERIKAFGIAIAVFDRDDSFDAQSDPIVRIEASRLRRSLERYYLLSGEADPIRIEVPKGGYVPTFHRVDAGTATRTALRAATAQADASVSEAAVGPAEHGGAPAGRARTPRPAAFTRMPRATVMAALAAVVIIGLGASLVALQPWTRSDQPRAETGIESRPSLMVAPFADLGTGSTDHFAAGLAEEVLSSLIRFKEFVVFDARASLAAVQDDPLDLGRRLGADYIVTGSVRRSAGRIRVNSQLVELATGATIWAKGYDEKLAVDRLFEIQDGIAASVAATVAQPYGVIHRDAHERIRRQPPHSLSAYECMLRAYAYRRRVTPEQHATARDCLEEAVVREPDYSDALAMVAMVYVDEFRFRFNPRPNDYQALDKALEYARRSAEVAPDNALAWLALFETDFFRGDLDRAFAAGDRAIALNPNHPEPKALVGTRLAHSGEWERGIALVEEALAMNPSPPGWYYFSLSMNAFRQGDDAAALRWAERIDLPGFFWTHALLAAVYGQLDREGDAARATARLVALYPDFEERARIELGRQHFEPAVLNRLVDGLRKAGLEIPVLDELG